MTRSLRLALLAGGVAIGWLAVETARSEPAASLGGGTLARSVLEAAGGACLLGVGLRAMAAPRERMVGWLLVLASYGWFAAEFNNPGAGAVVFAVGLMLFASAPPLVVHAVLAHPDGRLSSRPARLIVGAGYASLVATAGLLGAMVFDPRAEECAQCPNNLLLVAGDRRAHGAILHVGIAAGLAWAGAVIVLIGVRIVCSGPARRRVTGPVLVVAWLYVATVAADLGHGVGRGFLSNDPVDERLWAGQAAVLLLLCGAVALALWRARRRRLKVAHLVLELGTAPPPGGLRDALAAVLGDPSLELTYPLEDGRVVDAHGRRARLDQDATPIVRGGGTVALLSHRPRLFDEPGLLEEVAATARLALDNERLHAQAGAHLEALRALRMRVVATGHDARRRLERDLHDGAQQPLVALSLAVALARARGAIDPRFDEMQSELDAALTEVRELAQGVFPALLASEGLAVALQELSEAASTPLDLASVTTERFDPAVETAAFFLVSETARAMPGGRLAVAAVHRDGCLVVEVEADRTPPGAIEIADRVGAVDGRVLVTPSSDGRTRLHAEIPCGS